MSGLHEHSRVRQVAGEARRRWFASEDLDLILRISDSGDFVGFELCYDKRGDEHALCWTQASGFSHWAVDSGESEGWAHKQTPVLVPDGNCDIAQLYPALVAASRSLPDDVATFVLRKLEQHPDYLAPT